MHVYVQSNMMNMNQSNCVKLDFPISLQDYKKKT